MSAAIHMLICVLTITTEALDALEESLAWKRWQSSPAGLPDCSAHDIYRSFVGAQGETPEELVIVLGADNMGGGVPVTVAKALARLATRTTSPRAGAVDERVLDQVAAELGLYVYLLVDPITARPFYVGKGRGLRYAAHGLEAAQIDGETSDEESRKHRKINELRAQGLEHEVWILRYGLSSTEYTAVEAAAIDLLMSFPITSLGAGEARIPLSAQTELTNKRREEARGHGVRLLDSIVDEYAAPPLSTATPLLLITLNGWTDMPDGEVVAGGKKRFGVGYRPEWLVSATRTRAFDEIGESISAWWSVDTSKVEREGIRHAVAVHRGVTRALFEIVPDSWETVISERLDRRGRSIRKAAFDTTSISEGALFDAVIGRHGHRVPGRAKGAQNSIYYWPR